MKEKILLLMMLCALSSLCFAQYKSTFSYDASGNMTTRSKQFMTKTSSNEFTFEIKRTSSGATFDLRIFNEETRSSFYGKLVVWVVDVMTGQRMQVEEHETRSDRREDEFVRLDFKNIISGRVYGIHIELYDGDRTIVNDKLKFQI